MMSPTANPMNRCQPRSAISRPARLCVAIPVAGKFSTPVQFGLSAVSGCLLGACYLYPAFYWMAWVAMVPWLVTLDAVSIRRAYGSGLIFGVTLFATGSYWVAPFIDAISSLEPWQGLAVAALYWLVVAQAFGVLGLILALCRKTRGWPLVISLPVFGAIAFEILPYIFPLSLGVTQVAFLLSLQGTDLTGPVGLAVVLMLSNAWIADVITGSASPVSRRSIAVAVVLLCWLGYGAFVFSKWESAPPNWDDAINLGVVQTDAPASLAIPPPESGFSYAYPPEMAFYELLAAQGAELVIWPETRFKGYHTLAHVRASFETYVNRYGTGLLLQDLEEDAAGRTFNTAILLSPAGADQVYRKTRLIAFGETTPGAGIVPGVTEVAKKIFGDFHTPLVPGDVSPFFQHSGVAWIPLICYEVGFGAFVADAVRNSPRPPQWISVQSNDVWFAGTAQPRMHVGASQLRAIENRLPLVHVINNGPSVVVAPSGRVIFEGAPDERRGYLLRVALPKHGQPTFYNRFPLLFPALIIAVALVTVLLMVKSLLGRRTASDRSSDN